MWDYLRRLTAPPIFEGDEDKTRAAAAFNALLWSFLLILAAYAGAVVPLFVVRKAASLVIIAAVVAVWVGVRALLLAGRVQLASIVWLAALWALATVQVFFAGGVRTSSSVFFLVVPALAGLLLGQGSALMAIGVCALTAAGLAGLEVAGQLPPPYFPNPPSAAWLSVVVAIAYTVIPLIAAVRNLNRTLGVAREQVAERKQAEEALRVRTQQLEAIRAIDAEITRELELAEVLRLISERLSEVVGYGRGGVCLWDDAAQLLIPHTKLNELERERFGLQLGQGVAGKVAESLQGVIVNDYRTRPGVPPELLARTKVTAMRRRIGKRAWPRIWASRSRRARGC